MIHVVQGVSWSRRNSVSNVFTYVDKEVVEDICDIYFLVIFYIFMNNGFNCFCRFIIWPINWIEQAPRFFNVVLILCELEIEIVFFMFLFDLLRSFWIYYRLPLIFSLRRVIQGMIDVFNVDDILSNPRFLFVFWCNCASNDRATIQFPFHRN